MTFEKLKVRTRKELAEMAKKKRVSGWHGMKKDELIEALLEIHSDRKKSRSAKSSPKSKSDDSTNSRKPRRRLASESPNKKRILNGAPSGSRRDKLTAQACDPWWIMAQWEISSDMINRVEAAMGAEWHRAYPIIRVYDVTHKDLGTNSKSHVKDIKIHGQVDHWFIPVDEPAQQLKLEIGYTSPSGEFFGMARSNKVATPSPGTRGKVSLAGKQADNPEEFHIREIHDTRPTPFAFLEERANQGGMIDGTQEFPFQLEAELIVYGSADPRCPFTLMGEEVPVSKDGNFSVRFHLPNGRQVIPAVTVTPDGSETRTIVMAIERNTKELEPQLLEEMTP
ncbi:MAG: DUF4912 domain-containing protein [Planctomycetaceae bacterium]|nr:DUF4912 domain-containing protein [Planctomycetaceae bacterium]